MITVEGGRLAPDGPPISDADRLATRGSGGDVVVDELTRRLAAPVADSA